MKRKIILLLAMVAMLVCVLAISVGAETPDLYITFDVLLDGNTEYTKVYVENPESGNPRINLTFDFYSDVEFTQVIDKGEIIAMDFSTAVHSNPKQDYVDRFTTADASVFPKCEEIKWFSRKFTTTPSKTFNGWTQLKRFDFGCATTIDYNFLSSTGLESVVIPASVNRLYNGVFQNCKSLKTVKIEGNITNMGSGEFNGCTSLESVDLGQTTVIGESMFYGCTALKSVYSNGQIQEYAVLLNEGITKISPNAFYQCSSIKYLSLPSTLTYVGAIAFRDCKALEFVDFNGNENDIEFNNYGHFMGCTALKAVSLPDNVTILNNRIFNGCTNLQAVYLPANLVQMNTNGNGQGLFCYDKQMYFVQEPFEVRDENGVFYGDSFQMPEKPEIYYMPSTLTSAGGNVGSGTWFRECPGLNKTIVMPVAFTNSTVVQMFRETAGADNVKNVVYLGDMETIAWSERNHHINFIFANPNDRDISSVTFSGFYNNLNSDSYFYFCSTGYKYTMAKANVEAVAATKEENSYCHITEKTVATEVTCETPKMVADYCFCGAIISSVVEEGSVALGHSYTGEVYFSTIDLLTGGTKYTKCTNNCGKDAEEQVNVISAKGYSVKSYGSEYSFTTGYDVNTEALLAYEAQNGVTVSFGFAFNAVASFVTEDITLDSFKLNAPINANRGEEKICAFDYKLKIDDENKLDSEIIAAAYITVKNGENESVIFVNKGDGAYGGFDSVSYNKAAEKSAQ